MIHILPSPKMWIEILKGIKSYNVKDNKNVNCREIDILRTDKG